MNLDNINNNNLFLEDKIVEWVINLSNKCISPFVNDVLRLGQTFNFSLNLDKNTLFNFFKYLESYLDSDDKNDNLMRKRILNTISAFLKTKKHKNYIAAHQKITNTKKFIKQNNDLHITEADKGNVAVIIGKSLYIDKIETILNDVKYYQIIADNPLSKLINRTKLLTKKWKGK